MSDEIDQFHDQLDRLLDGETPPSADIGDDPLLLAAQQLRAALGPVPPDPEFRAQLKAELLEQYANNVVPFPRPVSPAAAGVSRWRRARLALIAAALGAAASIGLVIGYGNLHQHASSHSMVAHVVKPTATASATSIATETPSPRPSSTALPKGRHGNTPVFVPGNGVTLPTPPPHHATPARPTATQPLIVANNVPTTPVSTATTAPTQPPTAVPSSTPRATATTAATVLRVATPAPSATPVPPTSTVPPSATNVPPTGAPPSATSVPPTAVPPSATSVPATATHVPSTATEVPPSATGIPPSATGVPASATPVPPTATQPPATATQAPATATTLPPTQVPPSSTPHTAPAASTARPTATVPSPTSTRAPALPTATAVPASPTRPAATASSTPSAAPSATARTAPASDTPIPPLPSATTTPGVPTSTQPGPTEVAQVATPPAFATSAVQVPGTATATPPPLLHDQFPAPVPANAGPGSPLVSTVPFTPGALLQVITVPPPDPGPLAVYRPLQTPESPMDLLSSFGLVSADTKLLSQTAAKTVALVSIHSYGYRAELSPTSYGYHLKLVLLNAVQPSSVPLPPFDAGANARIFLNKYRLAPALNLDTVTALPDGDRTATFSEWAPFQLVGARASVTFSVRGVLRLADVRWVDISRADQAPGSPFALALQEVAAGQGSVHTTGALPDATSTITASTIIYVPVNDTDGIYYEPVYRLSGYTTSLVPFYLYVPAIDRSYLR